MDAEALRRRVLAALKAIAPELDEADLRADRPLREQVDLDSMDWLRFLTALHRDLGVAIPEADHGQTRTLADLLGYLSHRLP